MTSPNDPVPTPAAVQGTHCPPVDVRHRAEPLRLDPAFVVRVHAQEGPDVAQQEVMRAIGDLTAGLNEIDRAIARSDFGRIAQELLSMSEVADHIGLTGIAAIVRDVCSCVETGGGIAMAATLARLKRVTCAVAADPGKLYAVI